MAKTGIACLLIFFAPAIAVADEILVAVAANFSAPMYELVTEFARQNQHEVNVAYGSSGRLYAQISNGAPFQLFFSADQDKPRRLEQAGLAIWRSRFTYATGQLVLWTATEGMTVDSESLLSQSFNRLALANPALAPYGQAAVEVMDSLAVADASRPRWVLGENIAQTFQFVETENAELGFVALSQVWRSGAMTRGSGWIVPTSLHSPIKQDAVLLKRAEQCAVCVEFLEFTRSPVAQRILQSYGYSQ